MEKTPVVGTRGRTSNIKGGRQVQDCKKSQRGILMPFLSLWLSFTLTL